jgi:hypothetical protein
VRNFAHTAWTEQREEGYLEIDEDLQKYVVLCKRALTKKLPVQLRWKKKGAASPRPKPVEN